MRPRQDLNLRSLGPQPNALSAELRGQIKTAEGFRKKTLRALFRIKILIDIFLF